MRARVVVSGLSLGSLLVTLLACGPSSPAPAAAPAPAAPATWGGEITPIVSVKELMRDVIDPLSDNIFLSVGTEVTKAGVKEWAPKTDEDWERVEWAGVTLAEGLNALLIPGRRVAPPGTVSESPEHELNPEQIEEILKKEPEVWVGFVHALDDTVQEIQEAIRKRDLKTLNEAGGALDEVCENCHLHFWYPNDKKLIKGN